MKCPRCNCEFEYNFSKCPECGYEIQNNAAFAAQKPKKTSKVIIAAACAAVVICAGTIVWAVTNNNSINSDSEDDTSYEEIYEETYEESPHRHSGYLYERPVSLDMFSSESEQTQDNSSSEDEITFYGTSDSQEDWTAATLTLPDDSSTEVEYIDNSYFSKYIDTGCSVTVKLTYDWSDYYVFAVKDAVDWNALYTIDKSYIYGVPTADDAISGNAESGYRFSMEIYEQIVDRSQTFIQEDGFFSLTDQIPTYVTFDLSSDALKYLAKNTTKTDEGTDYGGLVFQMYGCKINKLTISDPLPLDENGFIS